MQGRGEKAITQDGVSQACNAYGMPIGTDPQMEEEFHMKRLILCFLACMFLQVVALADALPEHQDGFDYVLTEEGAVVTGWDNWSDGNAKSVLDVPTTLGGQPVIGIGKTALETVSHEPNAETFELVIPEGVVYLEQKAFEDCCAATTIYLPSTLRVIPEDCFFHVTAEIVFPNGNPDFVVTDGFLIAQESSTLLYAAPSSYNVPLPLVKRLGSSSLDNWLYEKTEVILPSTLESIGEFVFYDVLDITHIVLPNSVKHIDSRAFFCTLLETVVLSTELTEIPAYCFCDCSISSITIPDGVTYIGEYAIYRNWETIETVILPTTVQFVGYNAFPEETDVIALSPDTHFETVEEYQLRCPDGELW